MVEEAQMAEGNCSDSDKGDKVTVVTIEDEGSDFTPRDCIETDLPLEQEEGGSGSSQGKIISRQSRENDDAKSDEIQKAEHNSSTSAQLEQLDNSAEGCYDEQPNGENMAKRAPAIETDKLSKNPGLTLTATAAIEEKEEVLEDDTTIINLADQPESVCIEMESIPDTDRNNTENSCDKSPPDTTTLYFSESDSAEVESDVCRICHSNDEMEILISPCLCTGSVKFVHHSCLMSWLQRVVMSKCELCLYPLAVKRKRKPFSKWRLPEDKPFPILWLLTFVVAMTLNVASIAKDGSQRCVSNPCIIFYVVGSAGALLGLAFFYRWLRKTVRYISKWIALNQEWTLVGPPDLRTQMGQANLAYSTKSLSETDTTREQIA